MSKIDFYFDFTSPYSFLAWNQFLSEDEYWFVKNEINPVPIMVGRVFTLIESTGPGEVKSKREYLFKDCLKKAAKRGIELRSPGQMPFSPLPLLRMVIALKDDKDKQRDFITHTFSYGWKEGLNYDDYDAFKEYIIKNVGFSEDEFNQAAESKEARRGLKANIAQAVEKGVFGVPSLFHSNELYWGLDSLEFLKESISENINYNLSELDRFKSILEGEQNA